MIGCLIYQAINLDAEVLNHRSWAESMSWRTDADVHFVAFFAFLGYRLLANLTYKTAVLLRKIGIPIFLKKTLHTAVVPLLSFLLP